MEYLSIIGIVVYYLYKAYSANKEKQKQYTAPTTEYENPAPSKKKKGLFDEILEEIERAQKEQQLPRTESAPVPTIPKAKKTIIPTLVEKTKEPKWKPMESHFTPMEQKNTMETEWITMESHFTTMEGQRSTFDEVVEEKKVVTERTFARMRMSPKEALKAQIILERKF